MTQGTEKPTKDDQQQSPETKAWKSLEEVNSRAQIRETFTEEMLPVLYMDPTSFFSYLEPPQVTTI